MKTRKNWACFALANRERGRKNNNNNNKKGNFGSRARVRPVQIIEIPRWLIQAGRRAFHRGSRAVENRCRLPGRTSSSRKRSRWWPGRVGIKGEGIKGRGKKRKGRVEEGNSRSELEVSMRPSTVLVNIFFVPAAGRGTTHSRCSGDGVHASPGHARSRTRSICSPYIKLRSTGVCVFTCICVTMCGSVWKRTAKTNFRREDWSIGSRRCDRARPRMLIVARISSWEVSRNSTRTSTVARVSFYYWKLKYFYNYKNYSREHRVHATSITSQYYVYSINQYLFQYSSFHIVKSRYFSIKWSIQLTICNEFNLTIYVLFHMSCCLFLSQNSVRCAYLSIRILFSLINIYDL